MFFDIISGHHAIFDIFSGHHAIFFYFYLQKKAEQMLSQLNNQVQTLPSADCIPPPGFLALESTWDLKKQTRGNMRMDGPSYAPRFVVLHGVYNNEF